MPSHIVKSYEHELNLLTSDLQEMGNMARQILKASYDVTCNLVPAASQHVHTLAAELNQLDEIIEEKAITLIALRQPVAIDLRHIIASLRIAIMFERIGDLAKQTTYKAEKNNLLATNNLKGHLEIVFQRLDQMLSQVLVAFVNRDMSLAMQICLQDEFIDKQVVELMQILLNMLALDVTPTDIIDTIFVVKAIERIGDYIIKIACMVNYVVCGKKLTPANLQENQ